MNNVQKRERRGQQIQRKKGKCSGKAARVPQMLEKMCVCDGAGEHMTEGMVTALWRRADQRILRLLKTSYHNNNQVV